MKRIFLILLVPFVVILVPLLFLCWQVAVLFVLLFLLAVVSVLAFYLANKLLLKSNWYNNNFEFAESSQFITNEKYRGNLTRNVDVANLGSNPALYGFVYDNGIGFNWSTGFQLLDMDFEILKFYHSYVKKGGTIIIPIMPFSSVAQYLLTRREYCGPLYYSKFEKVLDPFQVSKFPYVRERKLLRRWPLLVYPKAYRYLLHDEQPVLNSVTGNRTLSDELLEKNAECLMDAWFREFQVSSLSDFRNCKWKQFQQESSLIVRKMIDFCTDRGLNVFLACPPMSRQLRSKFDAEIWKLLVGDFISSFEGARYMDYSDCDAFRNNDLYVNSLFLNVKGRKIFTEKILNDIKQLNN